TDRQARARCHLGGGELLLPFLLEGGEDLQGQPGRQHDHAVVVADHRVARLDRDAGAGRRDAAFPRYVTPTGPGPRRRGSTWSRATTACPPCASWAITTTS